MAKSKEWKKVEDGSFIDLEKQKSKPIEGKLVSITLGKSKAKVKKGEKPKKYQIYKIETKTGLIAISGTQLEQKLKGVKIGEEIRIIYQGKKKTSGGFKVNTFDVFTR